MKLAVKYISFPPVKRFVRAAAVAVPCKENIDAVWKLSFGFPVPRVSNYRPDLERGEMRPFLLLFPIS